MSYQREGQRASGVQGRAHTDTPFPMQTVYSKCKLLLQYLNNYLRRWFFNDGGCFPNFAVNYSNDQIVLFRIRGHVAPKQGHFGCVRGTFKYDAPWSSS